MKMVLRNEVINALNPGTFENDTRTFAVVVVSNLSSVSNPLITVKQMIEFLLIFPKNFMHHCDEERTQSQNK